MRKLLSTSVMILSLMVLSSVHAEAPIAGTMQAFLVQVVDEKEQLSAANDVEPDQVVEYQLTYVNKSADGINGLTVVGPVPEGTSYLSDTAAADVAAQFLVSIDGGKTYQAEPVVRTETKSNGEVVEVVVPSTEYTHLKWQAANAIDGDGGTQLYSYRVRIK